MAYQTIIVETKGRVGIVRLNRPNALNALNAQLIEELSTALDGLDADDGIGAILSEVRSVRKDSAIAPCGSSRPKTPTRPC